MDCVGYLLLFHVLLGVMTVNTMIGIIGIVEHKDLDDAFLHLGTVFAFLIMVVGHKLLPTRKEDVSGSSDLLRSLSIELFLITVYALAASVSRRAGLIDSPNFLVFCLVCLGSFSIYLQNNTVVAIGRFPTSAMVMTGNYISLLTHLLNIAKKSGKDKTARLAVKHFIYVHICFWGGVALMAWAVPHIDFFALLFPCAAIAILILVLKISTPVSTAQS